MKRIAILYGIAILFVACRYEPPPEAQRPQPRALTVWKRSDLTGKEIRQKFVLQPKVLSRCESGARLGEDGLVSEPAASFRPGDPIHLSMWLASSPEGLQVAMRVLGEEEREVGVARLDDVGGVKAVTLRVGQELDPGRYKLEGFWGGNLVCEKNVEVVR